MNKRRRPVTVILTDVENKTHIPDKDFASCIQRTPVAEMLYCSAVLMSLVATEADRRLTDSYHVSQRTKAILFCYLTTPYQMYSLAWKNELKNHQITRF